MDERTRILEVNSLQHFTEHDIKHEVDDFKDGILTCLD